VTSNNPSVIYAGTLIDGTGAPPISDGAVVIGDDGRIVYAGPAAEAPATNVPAARRLDMPDGTVLPGLIDSHLHLTFNARTEATSPAVIAQLVADDDWTIAIRAVQAAHACLGVGITTVRDCGAKGLVVLRLRDLINQGVIHGPRILACGMPITTTAGHCHWCGLTADNEQEAVRAARQMVREGADFVKVMATGGGMTVNSNIFEPQFSVAELSAMVREAHRLGRRLSAHSHSPSGQRHCLEAGVDIIEHCNWHTPEGWCFDQELMTQLIDAGTFIGITLSGPQQQAAGAATPVDELPAALLDRYETLRWMKRMGARIVLHSDAIAPITLYEDFPLSLVAAVLYGGFSPAEAVHASTGLAAAAIGVEAETGTLEAGKQADLLIVAGDVGADINAVRQTRQVLRSGVVVAHDGCVRTSPSGVIA
jgi:imidazolonepropionase-like amidohydrolase